MKTIFSILVTSLIFSICSCEDDNHRLEILGGLSPIWSYNFEHGLVGHMQTLYDERYIYTTSENGNRNILYTLDKFSGEVVATDKHFIENGFVPLYNLRVFLNEGVISTFSEGFFGYNLQDQTQAWNVKGLSVGHPDILCFQEYPTFTTYDNDDLNSASIHIVIDDTPKILYSKEVSDDSIVSILPSNAIIGNVDAGSLYTTISEGKVGSMNSMLVKIDLEHNIIIDTIAFPNELVLNKFDVPVRYTLFVDNFLVCAIGNYLCGFSLEAEQFIWYKSLDQGADWSGFIIEDETVYCNSWGKKVYAIDAKTGNTKWEASVSANGSNIGYINDVLYMIGADGYMHIIDATNGDKLYEIKAPSELENSADFFETDNMTVDKEAGLVYVCSYSTAYAYKAIR
jgi:outer membrane protein assembly factor BamB